MPRLKLWKKKLCALMLLWVRCLFLEASAPKLLKRVHLKKMIRGSVLVDIAIDQGGCFETSRPTTHEDPTYVVDGVVHYCVTNMPGAVARTSTQALNQRDFALYRSACFAGYASGFRGRLAPTRWA